MQPMTTGMNPRKWFHQRHVLFLFSKESNSADDQDIAWMQAVCVLHYLREMYKVDVCCMFRPHRGVVMKPEIQYICITKGCG